MSIIINTTKDKLPDSVRVYLITAVSKITAKDKLTYSVRFYTITAVVKTATKNELREVRHSGTVGNTDGDGSKGPGFKPRSIQSYIYAQIM